MIDEILKKIRLDCLESAQALPTLLDKLRNQHIAVVAGFGFTGTWLAAMVAALNDEKGLRARLTLIGRDPRKWLQAYPSLQRQDIVLQTADVRSAFEFSRETTIVIHAAGIADPRVQASDPHQVYQSILFSLDNSLVAASRLEYLQRFLNISSGLVVGRIEVDAPFTESTFGILEFNRLHNLYAEMRRAGEAMARGFGSQYRLPVSTARAFTFLGPFQRQNSPWALNNFIDDALSGREIRVHGAGSSRRCYLYGSDVAAWLLQTALEGEDDAIYNIGGEQPVSHIEAARIVQGLTRPQPHILLKTRLDNDLRSRDFIPDLSGTQDALGVSATVDLRTAIARTMQWQAEHRGSAAGLVLSGI
jgi:nucleoside-diphosphate-sugar epimerase